MSRLLGIVLFCLLLVSVSLGCSEPKLSLSGGILVTFGVSGERYRVFVTDADTVREVFAVERGES
ncbi:MAG: hypothetical protein V3R87_05975 [Dehalococcoidia bacterium]